jgi:hypothetical protein
MTERMKKVLERTEETLCRHLEDLNDMVDVDNGRIKDHMTLDGIKDCVKSLKNLSEVMKGNGSASTVKSTASAA